ncbi:hypothetical protein YC2023_079329 [Brassica napus]
MDRGGMKESYRTTTSPRLPFFSHTWSISYVSLSISFQKEISVFKLSVVLLDKVM